MTVEDATEKVKFNFRTFMRNMKRRLADASMGVFVIIGLLFALVGFFAGTGVRTIVLPPRVIVVTPGDEKNVNGTITPSTGRGSESPTGTQSPTNVPILPRQVNPRNPGQPTPKPPAPAPNPGPSKKPPIIEIPQPEIPPKGPIIKLCLPDLPVIGKVGINCKE